MQLLFYFHAHLRKKSSYSCFYKQYKHYITLIHYKKTKTGYRLYDFLQRRPVTDGLPEHVTPVICIFAALECLLWPFATQPFVTVDFSGMNCGAGPTCVRPSGPACRWPRGNRGKAAALPGHALSYLFRRGGALKMSEFYGCIFESSVKLYSINNFSQEHAQTIVAVKATINVCNCKKRPASTNSTRKSRKSTFRREVLKRIGETGRGVRDQE